MTRIEPALLFCALLALGACASEPKPGPQTRGAAASSPVAKPAKALTEPREAQLYLNVIDGLVRQERYGAALAFLDDFAASRKPLEPRYWLLRGNAAFGLDRRAEAEAAFARLEGTALAAQGWNGRGRVAGAAGDWREAAPKFGKAVASDPSNADFLNNLAFAELHLGDAAGGAGHLRQAHELAPGSDLIRNNLIIALTLSGDSAGVNVLLAGIKDDGRRQKVLALVRSAVDSNNHFRDEKS